MQLRPQITSTAKLHLVGHRYFQCCPIQQSLALYQGLNKHMWLVATTVDSAAIEHFVGQLRHISKLNLITSPLPSLYSSPVSLSWTTVDPTTVKGCVRVSGRRKMTRELTSFSLISFSEVGRCTATDGDREKGHL